MWRGVSLANKCLLLFGGAVVIIVVTALAVPWFRMIALIDLGQLEVSRQMVDTWRRLDPNAGAETASLSAATLMSPAGERFDRGGITALQVGVEQGRLLATRDRFIADAIESFEEDPEAKDYSSASFSGTSRQYRYAAAVRTVADKRLSSLIVLDRRPVEARQLVLFNAAFLLSAGSVVLTCSLAVFYFITHKVVLAPVRALKETTERVRRGNLEIRSDIQTGDEFEELSETFNSMLNDLQGSQNQLRGINTALDLKIGELAQTNTALYEAAKLKGEFLANVSHELRTPLNSIIGFAELLLEIARSDAAAGDTSLTVQKRIRYCENIVVAGRNLLGMINSLLEMAKIEAGRVELHVSKVNMRDACEALAALIHPLAAKKGITIEVELPEEIPTIETDAKKFQQIIFNFLSNAVKFTEPAERTGRSPKVTLRVDRLIGGDGKGPGSIPTESVRVSVIDNGPGIPSDEQGRVFEKFHQVDASHTREHSGTGLGLAISKELASLLHGDIQLVSEIGRGSMFSLIVPMTIAPDEEPPPDARLPIGRPAALMGRVR